MKTSTDLRGRHLLELADYSREELRYLIDLAAELKAAKREGREERKLLGKSIALIFEKDSTRTRCAFEVAAFDQGAHVTYIGPSGSHLGQKETAKDTARVLGRMYDAIEYRGFGQETVDELAEWSGSRSTTGSPTNGTRRRSWRTSSPSRSIWTSRSTRSSSATSETPGSTWRTPISSAAQSSGWTFASRARGRSGRRTRSSTSLGPSQPRPAP